MATANNVVTNLFFRISINNNEQLFQILFRCEHISPPDRNRLPFRCFLSPLHYMDVERLSKYQKSELKFKNDEFKFDIMKCNKFLSFFNCWLSNRCSKLKTQRYRSICEYINNCVITHVEYT